MDDFAKAPFTRSTQYGMISAKAEKKGPWKILSVPPLSSGKVAIIFLASWSAERDSSVRVAVKAKPAA
jgi:hypothetical protein